MVTLNNFTTHILLVAENKLHKNQQQKVSELFARKGIRVNFAEKRVTGIFDIIAIIVPCMYKHTTTWYYEAHYGKVLKITAQNPQRIFTEICTIMGC